MDLAVLLGIDLGNTGGKGVKLCVINNKLIWEEAYIPHAYSKMTELAWEQASYSGRSGRGRISETHTFRYVTEFRDKEVKESVPVTIGKSIVNSGAASTIMGSGKYFLEYFAAYFVALLCEMFPKDKYPKGYDCLYVVVGVPSADWRQAEQVLSLINRAHYIIDPDGSRRKFVVREAMTADENGGGMVNAIYRMKEATPREAQSKRWVAFKPDSTIALLDSGGWLGSIARGVVGENGYPVIDYSEGNIFAIRSGIVPVRQALRDELENDYEELRGSNNITDTWLDRVIRQGYFTLSGGVEKHDASGPISRAAGRYLNPLKAIWENNLDKGRFTDILVMTGGTITALYPQVTEILKHNRIVLAEEPQDLYRANVRGMLHILIDQLRESRRLPIIFQPFLKED